MLNGCYILTFIFLCEIIIKLISYKRQFFKDGWNKFDIFVLITTATLYLVSIQTGFKYFIQAMLMRSFKLGKSLTHLKQSKSLRMIFNSFINTLPSLLQTGGLLFLLIYQFLKITCLDSRMRVL